MYRGFAASCYNFSCGRTTSVVFRRGVHVSKLEKCLVVFEVGNTGLRVTVRSKLTGRVAGFDMLGEAQGVARFEFDEVPTLISQESPPEPTPAPSTVQPTREPMPAPKKRGRPPKPKPDGSAYRDAVRFAVEGVLPEKGEPAAVNDEGSDWRPQEV